MNDLTAAEARKLELAPIVDWITANVLPQLTAAFPESEAHLNSLRDELAVVLEHVEKLFAPGLTWDEKIAALGAGSAEIISLLDDVGRVGALPGKVKKEIATIGIMALYDFVDGGGDGSQDRVKIPWVPAGISNRIERWLLRFTCEFGIETAVAIINKFTKKADA